MVLGFSVAPVVMMFLVSGALFESVKELPGFPTDNYFEYLAPAAVLMTTVPGIANAAVGLATDFQSRYLYKPLTLPVSIGSIMAGRLLADGARLFFQAGVVLLLAVALGAEIATGVPGALLILLTGTLFGIVTFGVLTANLALKSKDPAAVQAPRLRRDRGARPRRVAAHDPQLPLGLPLIGGHARAGGALHVPHALPRDRTSVTDRRRSSSMSQHSSSCSRSCRRARCTRAFMPETESSSRAAASTWLEPSSSVSSSACR